MGGKSIRKGKAFEREVAKVLGEKLAGDERAFRRMPLQGRSLEKFEGDIIANPDSEVPEGVREAAKRFLKRYLVDAKDWKGWNLDGVVWSEGHKVWEWWRDLDKEARAVGRKPFLVVKLRGKMWVMLWEEGNGWPWPERAAWIKAFGAEVLFCPLDEIKPLKEEGEKRSTVVA